MKTFRFPNLEHHKNMTFG